METERPLDVDDQDVRVRRADVVLYHELGPARVAVVPRPGCSNLSGAVG